MEKDYTVKLYHFGKGPDEVFTKTQLLEVAGMITKTTPFTDLNAAIEVLANDFDISPYQVLDQTVILLRSQTQVFLKITQTKIRILLIIFLNFLAMKKQSYVNL